MRNSNSGRKSFPDLMNIQTIWGICDLDVRKESSHSASLRTPFTPICDLILQVQDLKSRLCTQLNSSLLY